MPSHRGNCVADATPNDYFVDTANHKYLFAGGPGAGKTTVLDALASSGLYCAGDSARAIIRSRVEAGLSPRPGPLEFANSIFDADVANYLAAPAEQVSIFDRGVVDALGMLKQSGGMSEGEITSNLCQYPYNQLVFLFPPWEEIYQTDEERDQTFAESVAVFTSVKSWYVRCGYELVEVPHGRVAQRVEFVEGLI
jgi:predicted ATPase